MILWKRQHSTAEQEPEQAEKKGSTTNNTGYKSGRIVISCLESEEMAIKQKAKEQNITVSKLIIDSVLKN